MVSESDVRGLRYARVELARRGIEYGRADLRISHGVLTVRGILARSPNAQYSDLRAEVEHVSRALRAKAEIRDVVLDCAYTA